MRLLEDSTLYKYEDVITFLKHEFNITPHNNIKKVQVIEDNSFHYLYYLDAERGWKPAQVS